MANSLLDFVMSLVRDPDAAAQYAADPTQAIADANLVDVTSVDVDHLIPVVAESMSTAVPSGGVDTVLDSSHNVWASGAATAAFDAFDDHLPAQGSDVLAGHVPTVANVIQQPQDGVPTIVDHGFDEASVPSVVSASDAPQELDLPTIDDVHVVDAAAVDVGHVVDAAAVDDQLEHPHDPGFDIFA